MSVDQVSPRPSPRPAKDARLVEYGDFIESKIQSTRRAVKLTDLATMLVALGSGLLAYLLIVAVADHWVIPGGFTVPERTVLFIVLVIGVAWFAYTRLWPLLAQSINPVYAARAIEDSSPSLKNSLINLLLFRQRRTDIPDAVYRTLEEQAAQRLTRVHAESSIDRSWLIRLGYVLIAVVALAGLYKVLSPKDPLIAAERVLLPWADIVPASRVSISAVTPGSVTVARGETVDVSAEIHGIDYDDPVALRYWTDDGQVVGKAIPMKPAGDGLRFTCRLNDEANESQHVGLTRNLVYRLEAGDARSLNYKVNVVAAPSILVERVDYHYPPYTGLVDRSVDGLGDIRAIEGTRITIHARANGPIRESNVDFDADGRPDLRMTAKGELATAEFELALREDRQTPTHASYVLRFTNDEGHANRDPVKHEIIVERDLDPEASILQPKEKSIDLRLDETVRIEAEARDPDYALSAMQLKGEVDGRSVLDEPLFKGRQAGKVTGRYSFQPSQHRLKAGDVVQFWIEAADSRSPKPNVTTTEHRFIRIISPNPPQPPPDRIARNDRQPNRNDGQQDQNNSGDAGGAGSDIARAEKQNGGSSGDQQKPNDSNQQDQGGKQSGGENSSPSGGDGKADSGNSKNAHGSQKNSKGNDSSDSGKPGNDSQANQSQGDQSQGGKSSGSKSGGQTAGDQNSSGAGKSSDQQTGAGAAGGQSSKDTAQPDGARPDPNQPSNSQNGGERGGHRDNNQQARPSDNRQPISPEGDNDGEAFERIQQHMERTGQLKNDNGSGSNADKNEHQQPGSNQHQGAQQQGAQQNGDQKQDARNGESQSAKDKSADEKNGRDNKSSTGNENSTGEQNPANQQQPGSQGKEQGAHSAAEPRHDGSAQKENQPGENGKQHESPNGQSTTTQGPAGGGKQQNGNAKPNSQLDQKPSPKREQTGSKDQAGKSPDPSSGAAGKKESDSQGDQGGDKAGGGESNAGQKAPREGTGSAGQHQSADTGTGESAEKGKGDTSKSGGHDSQSDHNTGSSGGQKGEPGNGSQQRNGQGNQPGGGQRSNQQSNKPDDKSNQSQGDKSNDATRDKQSTGGEQGKNGSGDSSAPGNKSANDRQAKNDQSQVRTPGERGQEQPPKNDNSAANQPKNNEQANPQSAKNADQGKGDARQNPSAQNQNGVASGSGTPGAGGNPQRSIEGSAPEGDAANLDYARKQTDLVLEKLSDELNHNKVDDHLLKELGWSRDDLRRFVERWQRRKDAAARDDATGDAAKRELDDALRSLGLHRGKLQQSTVTKDTLRDLKEGYRGPVPAEYQDRLRAYNEGVSRARHDEDSK